MNRRVLAATVAGSLLVGAGFVTASLSNPGVASAQEDPESESPEGANVRASQDHGSNIEDVLSDLVADGTITQSQADAILEALAAKAEEFRSVAGELRELIEQFLEDDVITAQELEQLPDVFPFNDLEKFFGDALDDGQITRDELAAARPHPKAGAFWGGVRFGALLDDGGIDQEEYDSLADDHPLKQADVADLLEDGVISIDELRGLRLSQSDSGDAA